jgi:PTH1 family peptidyl-tRNA hydrolase
MMKLIVGLGNPGFLYARNRHNIGFMCVRQLARAHAIRFDRKQGQARTGIGRIGASRVILARPQTYMNASGDSVAALTRKLDITPDNLIVIHDDLDLPVGKIRLRRGGGSGGHKGIESIALRLGTTDFSRIRVGIGRPDDTGLSPAEKEAAVIDYVLANFTNDEKKVVDTTIPEVVKAVAYLINRGITAAMNRFN